MKRGARAVPAITARPAPRQAAAPVRWLVLCEHASCAVPRAYRSLGLARELLRTHIGWDIGAAEVQRVVATRLGASFHAGRWSRLLVDLNRAIDDPTLIVGTSDGVAVPGNARVSRAEHRRRVELYYTPYHEAIDRMVRRERKHSPDADIRLLSLHSFTPVMNGRARSFDIGVLYDAHVDLARRLGRALAGCDYRVRYNQPYSGLDGLIFSARTHGDRHAVRYVELEINNRLIETTEGAKRVGNDVADVLGTLA